MADLFTIPPFDADQYIIDRENIINDEISPIIIKRVTDLQAQGKSYTNPLKEKYDKASPAEQLRMMGIKSGKAGKVLTVAEDKAKTQKRHAEANLQILCCKWVKKWFPDDRIIIHKREGLRTGFNRAVLSIVNNNSDGYPDHEFNCAVNGILLIEFKKPGETWLLKDGLTVKTAYQHQYAMHVQLRKENKPVYFCNDFDKFRELYKAHKAGTPLQPQLYKY